MLSGPDWLQVPVFNSKYDRFIRTTATDTARLSAAIRLKHDNKWLRASLT
jgi:hypothetical protein